MMEKYAVETVKSDVCNKCNKKTEKHGSVFLCPEHGAIYEIPGADDGERILGDEQDSKRRRFY